MVAVAPGQEDRDAVERALLPVWALGQEGGCHVGGGEGQHVRGGLAQPRSAFTQQQTVSTEPSVLAEWVLAWGMGPVSRIWD